MAVPTMEESALCSQLIERVKDYFQSAEHKKEFEEWYKTKYHKLSMADLELLSIGLINDMYAESRNDDYKYAELATQEDFNRF